MREKIKSLFSFLGNAWRGSIRGKIGIALTLIAIIFFVRMFFGHATPHGLVINEMALERERATLAAEQKRVAAIEAHIRLIQSHSPDFITELSHSHLNMGDPRWRILR